MSQTENNSEHTKKQIYLPKLREFLAQFFNMNEIELLCFNLDFDFEEIKSESKARTTMLLVKHYQRRKELPSLLIQCKKERPNVDWDSLYQQPQSLPDAIPTSEIRQSLSYLKALDELLAESKATFISQNTQRNRLYRMLYMQYENLPQTGYNDIFAQYYDQMNKEELELFHLIRGMTKLSIKNVNENMQKWLQDHPVYQLFPKPTPSTEILEENLLQLKIHLNMWFPKYIAVFLKDEKQSLVYLNDEKRQGIGFPKEIEQVVTQAIHELKTQLNPPTP